MASEDATKSLVDAVHGVRIELTTLRLVIMHILLSHREDKELISGVLQALTSLRDTRSNEVSRGVINEVLTSLETVLARIIQEGSGFGREARASAC